ncbi:calcium-binding protein [Shinella kummerowiae]|uniref:calcium-binding protein n=1 Tax=Shinella kummerowiae TaxID=417745 RepID=UPI0021B537D0|nr:calcium-binding protein [Shinella kummerowiae]MCT7662444.1 calcium-binding protein [Shinella kummerowiae]
MDFLKKVGGVFKGVTFTPPTGLNPGSFNVTLMNGSIIQIEAKYENDFHLINKEWIYDGPGLFADGRGALESAVETMADLVTPTNLSLYNDDSDSTPLNWSFFEIVQQVRTEHAPGVSWKISVYGAGGDDRITTGSTKDWVYGGDDSDTIITGPNNDFLFGGTGVDTLSGGAGNDSFVFNTALGSSNIDSILDFNNGNDTIRLDNAVFKALGASGALNADAFLSSANGIVAADSEDRIIYNKSSGLLLYDADGVGGSGPMAFAKLQSGLNLTASDFLII